jgi:hypothetical protein
MLMDLGTAKGNQGSGEKSKGLYIGLKNLGIIQSTEPGI